MFWRVVVYYRDPQLLSVWRVRDYEVLRSEWDISITSPPIKAQEWLWKKGQKDEAVDDFSKMYILDPTVPLHIQTHNGYDYMLAQDLHGASQLRFQHGWNSTPIEELVSTDLLLEGIGRVRFCQGCSFWKAMEMVYTHEHTGSNNWTQWVKKIFLTLIKEPSLCSGWRPLQKITTVHKAVIVASQPQWIHLKYDLRLKDCQGGGTRKILRTRA